MRIRAIMLGTIAALALATPTAGAGTPVTHRASESLVSLAATATVATTVDREAVTLATRNADSEKAAEPAEKPAVAVSVAPRVPISSACQHAIDTLKAMHQADVAEDTAERAAQQPLSAATMAADRAEDLAEVQRWTQALTAARMACLPQPTAACQAAITRLQALLPANRPQEWSDLVGLPTQVDLTALRAALTAVAAACADRD